MLIEPVGESFIKEAATAAEKVWRIAVEPKLGKGAAQNARPEDIELWQTNLSAPFPAQWRAESMDIVFYAYSVQRTMALADGVRVGPVWGEVVLPYAQNFTPKVTVLKPSATALDVQGVRPLTGEEGEVLDVDVFRLLHRAQLSYKDNGTPPAVDRRLRAYYCLWKNLNGVVFKQIAPKQQAFFDWLGCDPVTSPR